MLGDALYWLLLLPIVFTLLLLGTRGEVRFYVLLGLLLGAGLYLKLLSQFTMPMIKWVFTTINQIFNLLSKIINIIWRVLVLPFRGLFLAVVVPWGYMIKIIYKIPSVIKISFSKPVGKLKQWLKPKKD